MLAYVAYLNGALRGCKLRGALAYPLSAIAATVMIAFLSSISSRDVGSIYKFSSNRTLPKITPPFLGLYKSRRRFVTFVVSILVVALYIWLRTD